LFNRAAEEAIAHCRKAIEIKPGSALANNTLGAALDGVGRSEEAIAAYKKQSGSSLIT